LFKKKQLFLLNYAAFFSFLYGFLCCSLFGSSSELFVCTTTSGGCVLGFVFGLGCFLGFVWLWLWLWGRFFNIAAACFGVFAMLESCGRIFMLSGGSTQPIGYGKEN
jgi:hypothetical protein